MDELTRELARVQDDLAPAWNVERASRLYAATQQRGRRRAVRRTVTVAVLTMTAVAALALRVGREPAAEIAGSSVAPTTTSGHVLRLADGSRAHNSKERVGLRLVAGRAHFDVVRDATRSFVVEAGPYRVEVIGTSFDVDRSEREVQVAVSHGKVRVYGPSGAHDVSAGESKRFAIAARVFEPVSETSTEPAEPAAADEPAPSARPKAKRASAPARWRSLTQSGQYDAAFALVEGGGVVDDEPAALMDAADAARLSGHPQSAVKYLEQVVRDHRHSPVAPLAAFTLGRVYLDRLGQPDRAAEAFERARQLSPTGSLAQDALAREVEALSKGGNAERAYLRAQQYLRQYPKGRRVRAVQLYGGLE
jgi:transmembrane sensor